MGKKKKLPYKEGDWFAVPLRDNGYVVGLIAREWDWEILGYFFAPRRKVVPKLNEVKGYKPEDAIYIGRFGDGGFINEKWPIIGQSESWNKNQWPIPLFGKIDSINPNKAWKIKYEDFKDLYTICPEQMIPCSPEEAESFPEDVLHGYGALQIVLSKLLPKDENFENETIDEKHNNIQSENLAISNKEENDEENNEEEDSEEDFEFEDDEEEEDENYKQLLLVYFPLSNMKDETMSDLTEIFEFEDELELIINQNNAGVFDGDEFCLEPQECTLYMYSKDINKLYTLLEDKIRNSYLTKNGYIIKRYGSPGAKEIRIDI